MNMETCGKSGQNLVYKGGRLFEKMSHLKWIFLEYIHIILKSISNTSIFFLEHSYIFHFKTLNGSL